MSGWASRAPQGAPKGPACKTWPPGRRQSSGLCRPRPGTRPEPEAPEGGGLELAGGPACRRVWKAGTRLSEGAPRGPALLVAAES